MNDFAKETPSELLIQLLDNELDSASEASLYEALGSSAELQEEMKHHLAVREAIGRDIEAFTPPADAVKSVFASLGYTPPPTATTGIIRKPFALSFLKRATVPLLLLLLGTYGAYNILNSIDNNETDITKHNSISNSKTEHVQSNLDNGIISNNGISNVATDKVAASPKNRKNFPIISSYKENSSAKVNNEVVALNNTETKIEYQNNIQYFQTTLSPIDNGNFSFSLPTNQTSFSLINPNQFIDKSESESQRIAVYLKGINNFNSELGTPFSDMSNVLNNFSGGFSFLGSDDMNLSVELGLQQFVINTDNSIPTSENKSVFWIALDGKYSPEYIKFMNINPYANFSLGFGTFGSGLIKYGAGFEYKPSVNSELGFMVGIEQTSLRYSADNLISTVNNWYFGISYGF
jgi:hypothetical protein